MAKFEIRLPQMGAEKIKYEYLITGEGEQADKNVRTILSVFDTDQKKGELSQTEVNKALKFLKEQEAQIGVRKGDSIITSDDIDNIARNEIFNEVRGQFKTEEEFKKALTRGIMLLSGTHGDVMNPKIYEELVEFTDVSHKYPQAYTSQPVSTGQEVKLKNGKSANLYNTGHELYVTNQGGSRISNPVTVAECAGLQIEKSGLFGSGNTLYYKDEEELLGYTYRPYKQYYNWNQKSHSFEMGDRKTKVGAYLYNLIFEPKVNTASKIKHMHNTR